MKTFIPHFRAGSNRLTLVVALCLGADLLAAAEKKPDEKETSKKATVVKGVPADPSKTPPITIVFPKSNFATAPEAGQDPFFPSSKRRLPKVPEPPKQKPALAANTLLAPPAIALDAKPAVVVAPPDPIGSANLALRGIISGTKARRVAVLHTGARTYDFQRGDSTLIRLPNDKQLKIRCVDVRERSAVFESDGQTKELFLREGVF